MTKHEYFHSTPKDVRYVIEGYNNRAKKRMKETEYHSWLSGIYVLQALGCAFSSGNKYPESPFTGDKDGIKDIAERTGKTEEEMNAEMVMATMRIMQANANIEKIP